MSDLFPRMDILLCDLNICHHAHKGEEWDEFRLPERIDEVCGILKKIDADIYTLQEVPAWAIGTLQAALGPTYQWEFRGYTSRNYLCVLATASRVGKPVNAKGGLFGITYEHGETGKVVFGECFQPVWIGEILYVNTHLPTHINAREPAGRMLHDVLGRIGSKFKGVVWLGDMNTFPDEGSRHLPAQYEEETGLTQVKFDSNISFCGHTPDVITRLPPEGLEEIPLDNMFYGGDIYIEVGGAHIISDAKEFSVFTKDGKRWFPSDHFALTVKMTIPL